MTAPATHRITWRCTECTWGLTVPGRNQLQPTPAGRRAVLLPDDQEIVHEVMFEHVAKHNPIGTFTQEVTELGPDEDWDED